MFRFFICLLFFSRVFQNQNQNLQLSFSFHKVKSDKQKYSDYFLIKKYLNIQIIIIIIMAESIIINHREKMAKHFDKALVSLLNTKFIIIKKIIIFMNFLRLSIYHNLTYITGF